MISYIGGKFRQAKWIESFIPRSVKIYAEVFGGAYWNYIKGGFLCEEAHYNDVNRFMVNLFACCVDYKEFSKLIDSTEPQNHSLFEQYKEDVSKLIDIKFDIPDFDIAHKYVYLVTQTFSGIMSENVKMVDLKGKYKSKYLSFADRLHSPKIQQKLDIIQTHNLSYSEFIPLVDSPDTILYLDPPYYGTENLYAFHNFGIKDHENLSNVLKLCKSRWILSYYEFDDLNKWFPKNEYHWEYKDFRKASMASKGNKQSTGTEVLVMNY